MMTLALAIALAAAVPPQAGTSLIEEVGPRGGSYSHLAASRRSPVVALAVHDDGGVYRTADGGQTYSGPVHNVAGEGGVLDVDFTRNGRAFVATPIALHVSDDGGLTWGQATLPPSSHAIASFAASALLPDDLWVGVANGDIYRSLDGGSSWGLAGSIAPDTPARINVDPTDAEQIAVVGWSDAHLSADGGATFSPVGGLAGLFVNEIVDFVAVEDRLLISVAELSHGGPLPYVLRSDDRGATWTPELGGLFDATKWSFRTDPLSTSTIFAVGTEGDLRVSFDDGQSWQLRSVGGGIDVRDVAFPSQASPYAHVLTESNAGRFERSTGAFEAAPGGPELLQVRSVAIDPGDEQHLVARVGFGAFLDFESFDGGSSWGSLPAPTPAPAPSANVATLIDGAGRLLTAAPGGLFAFDGTGWDRILPVTGGRVVSSFAASQSLPGTLYASIEGPSVDSIATSHDGGATWAEVNICTGSCIFETTSALFVADRPGMAPRLVLLRTSSGTSTLFVSDDLGATLTLVPGGQFNVRQLVQNPRDPARFAVNLNGPVHVTDDAFETSTPLPAAGGGGPALIGSASSGFVLRTWRSSNFPPLFDYYESFDGGQTFAPMPELGMLEGVLGSVSLAVSESHYYAAGNFGLVRRTLEPVVSEPGCTQSVPNGAGRFATLSVLGSASVSNAELRLDVHGLPAYVTCLPVGSMSAGFVPNPGGSLGDLCLSGDIGRFNGAIQSSGPTGVLSVALDPQSLPQPTGPVAATVGTDWHFQVWHRDFDAGQPSSHLTSSARLTWTQ